MATIDHKIKQLRTEVIGYFSEIATEADVSKVTVSKVLNGVYMNKKVVDAAIKVRDRLRMEKKELEKELMAKI